MTPKEFIDKYYPYAIEVEKETGVPALASMAQCCLESGYGKKSIGNNLFGIKYHSGDWNYQEVLTTEYHKSPDEFKGKKIKSKTYDKDKGMYCYKIWDYFADYLSPKDSFIAHAKLLLTDRYKPAFKFKHDPKLFLAEVARCGYATDPNYASKMSAMVDSVKKRL